MALVSRNFSDIVTFTRASNAWYFNSAGVLTQAASNLPRLDYDPSTLAPRGLLIEEQRTNLLQRSSEFNNAYWSSSDTSVLADQALSPDGTVSADLITEGSAGTALLQSSNVTIAANTAHTFSIFVKRGNHDWIRVTYVNNTGTSGASVWFNLSTTAVGTVGAFGSGSAFSASIQNAGNGWYRLIVTGVVDATSTLAFVRTLSATADNSTTRISGGTRFLWGAQLEAGAFATSYIPTTTAAATRAADVAVITGANFTSFYRADEGTLFVEGSTFGGTPATRRLLQVDDGSTNNRIIVGFNGSTSSRLLAQVSAVSQADVQVVISSAANTNKVAGAYKLNDFNQASNGTAGTTDTSATVPTVNVLRVGIDESTAPTTILNGWIRRIVYYPRRLTNAELQALTA